MSRPRYEKNAEIKKYEQRVKNRVNYDVSEKSSSTYGNEKFGSRSWRNTSDSIGSQNFNLRISDSVTIDDSDDELEVRKPAKNAVNKEDSIVIVISDSSDDENSDDLPKSQSYGYTSPVRTCSNNKGRPVVDSFELSDEDSNIFMPSLGRKKTEPETEAKKRSSQSTSSETDFELKIDSDKESIVHDSFSVECTKNRTKKDTNPESTNIFGLEKFGDIRIPTTKKLGTPGSVKLSECTTPLSKRDAKKLIKIIRSKRVDSPVLPRATYVVNETDSEEVTDEDQEKVPHPAWIEDSGDENANSAKAAKTHVSRFLNPTVEPGPGELLSEQKKQEISKWLMTAAEPRNDDSISVVPTSQRNSSPGSGDSSLERLEVNYETPNNRNKFHTKSNSVKTHTNGNNLYNPLRLVQSVKPRQSIMDEYLKKTKVTPRDPPKPKDYTPISVGRIKEITERPTETPKTDLVDCADILDKLYGNVWRQKADILLATSEPRKPVELRDRGVQTEQIPKPKKTITKFKDRRNDDSFQMFLKNIKPNLNTTKKPAKKNNYQDSFINESSPDESGDTTYLTALTSPRISAEHNFRRREMPVSATTRKAIEICDSDSEDENYPRATDNRRKLSYSDDENDGSNTSEYDPDDVVPPKPILPKTSRPLTTTPRFPAKPQNSLAKAERPKTFLSSLSATVPLESAHPDAKKYRLNFKTMKDDMVKHLFTLYNENIFDNQLPHDMLIEWNVRMRGTAGFCYNKKLSVLGSYKRTSRIVLATKILDRPDRLRDTLVHELCHAAAWLVNEVSDGHGPFWKSWASKAMRTFPELPPIKRCHDYEISTKYTYRCVQCGYSIGRHSKSLDIERKRCGRCLGKFELLLNRVTKSGTKLQIPKTSNTKQPSAFALFVKENYSTIRKKQGGMAHKEVMQLLGQQFSAIKLSKKNDNISDKSS